jgi:hypothetical protein
VQPNFDPDHLDPIEQTAQTADAELELLRYENDVLLGLMAGGYAYFLRQLMIGQQSTEGLSPLVCKQTIIDALRRVQATQTRFGYEYLQEIEAVLEKMTQTLPLESYLSEIELPAEKT